MEPNPIFRDPTPSTQTPKHHKSKPPKPPAPLSPFHRFRALYPDFQAHSPPPPFLFTLFPPSPFPSLLSPSSLSCRPVARGQRIVLNHSLHQNPRGDYRSRFEKNAWQQESNGRTHEIKRRELGSRLISQSPEKLHGVGSGGTSEQECKPPRGGGVVEDKIQKKGINFTVPPRFPHAPKQLPARAEAPGFFGGGPEMDL